MSKSLGTNYDVKEMINNNPKDVDELWLGIYIQNCEEN